MSKKLEQKQQRRLAEERKAAEQRKAAMKRNILTLAAVVIVLGIVVGSIYAQRQSGEGPGALAVVGVSESEANCGDVEEFKEQEATHISVDETHEPYNSSPPTSGPHYEIPAETAFFPDQIPAEQVVHNLEHGAIVIWYAPDAPQETLDNIEALVDQETQATVAVPYPDIESPYTFALTGWTSMQLCEQVSQDVVDDFRRDWQGQGPEKLTPPFDG